MTGATSGAGTTYPSGAPEVTLGFSGVRVTRSLVFRNHKKEEFEDTKGEIRIRISKKNRQHNDQK
jgi:hypothetical protein